MEKENKYLDTVVVSGKKCDDYNSTYPDCHCNNCHKEVIGYAGKEKGKTYLYNGRFAPQYLQSQKVTVEMFFVQEEEEPSTCEAFIKLLNGSGGQCEWIPREEVINNLIEI